MRGMTLNELIAWQPPYQRYIISEGILVASTKMILFGKFETWKSMLSIHTAFTIANGLPWFGYKTIKSPTYYLQIEVPQPELRERAMKYAIGNHVTSDSVWFCTEPYIKLDKGFGQTEFEKELVRCKPKVVIVDPIYKVVSGRMTDEYDMRQFMDRMDLLMDKYKFSLILVHHDRKSQLWEGEVVDMGADDMFGTSIFVDWCDTSIRTMKTTNEDEVKLVFEKARHAQQEMRPIVLQVDRATLSFRRL